MELSVNGRNVNARLARRPATSELDRKRSGPGDGPVRGRGNGHPLRRMTLPGEGGGDDVLPGQNSVDMKLFKQKPDYGYLDWKLPDSVGRVIYYQVLAQFPDGSYAYSPTIWSRPFFGRDELCAQWIFAPSGTERPVEDCRCNRKFRYRFRSRLQTLAVHFAQAPRKPGVEVQR